LEKEKETAWMVNPDPVSETDSIVVYFDTNVFGHLLKKNHGITECDDASLRSAIKSGVLSVVVGLHVIDETAANPRDPVPELRLIWDVCDWDRIVKPADILLRDDMRHFAYNAEPSHPFLDAAVRDGLRHSMRRLLEDPSQLSKLRDLVASARPQQKQFRLNIQQLRRETQAQFFAAKEREVIDSFNEYFEKESGLVAGWLTEHVRLKNQCQARPLEEFLKVRSVRMAVGLTLSYIWAANIEKLNPKPSDGRDFQHAIAAAGSGADLFVTHDEELAKLVARVPIKRFRVTTFSQLVEVSKARQP